MRKPSNTARDEVNTAALFGQDPAWIVRQEERGAQEAVASESLPSKVSDRGQWEALGFVFGQPFDDDPLFCPVMMPPGWSKRRTDHAMWNDIVDAAGNKRGSFFYKAAFYDRGAHLYSPDLRYEAQERHGDHSADFYTEAACIRWEVRDAATGSVLFTTTRNVEGVSPDSGGDHHAWWVEHEKLKASAREEATAWLTENYPDWRNPAAYWPT